MRAVIQRVLSASVAVDGEVVGELDRPGLLVYLGVTHDDGATEVAWTARKIWDLRLLRDEQSASDVGAPVLVVSQFTLYGDARKGRRPTWQAAAPGPVSEPLYDAVCAELERLGAHVERGRFGADMRVESVNDGPITLVLDSPRSAFGPVSQTRAQSTSMVLGQLAVEARQLVVRGQQAEDQELRPPRGLPLQALGDLAVDAEDVLLGRPLDGEDVVLARPSRRRARRRRAASRRRSASCRPCRGSR